MCKLFSVIILLLLAMPYAVAETEPEEVLIEIPLSNDNCVKPRTPCYSTFIRVYYSGGVIYFDFNCDVGCFDVLVTNDKTNTLWMDTVCSSIGYDSVLFTQSSGSYTITLISEIGDILFGSFTIE